MYRRSYRLMRGAEIFAFLVADVFSMFVIFKLAVYIRTDFLPLIYAGFPEAFPHGKIIDVWWLFIVWIFFFIYEGLYTRRFSFWDEIKALWKVSFYSVFSIFVIMSLGKMSGEFSRTVDLLMGMLALIILPVVRGVLKKGLRRLGLLKRRVLILGAGETGRLVLKALLGEPNYGYHVCGFVDDDLDVPGKRVGGLKVHKGLGRVERYMGRCAIQDVFVAIPEEKWGKIKGIINRLQHKAERVLFVPGISGIAVLGTSLQHFFQEQTFALELKNNLAEPLNLFVKKCFDFILCVLFLPFLFLLTCLMALIIKLDSRGPVLFSHERMGRHGKSFRCLKFRTMYCDAENRLAELLASSQQAMQEWEQYRKLRDDPRITRVGRFLRETSLDELPQIFNVLRGEMSLVGPRPVMQDEIDDYYKDDAESIFSVPPGITGLWQVSGRSNADYDYRIALDSWYIRNWNPWLDVVIILKTIGVVFRKEGAL